MSQGDSIAIGMPTYNRGARIRETLDAIAQMDNPDGRISRLLIIDNNSTDDTPEHIDAFIASNPPIPTFRIVETNQGERFARLRFFAETDEPIAAMLDDDVIPDRAWARVILEAMDADPKIGAVGSRVRLRFASPPNARALACAPMLAQQDFGDEPHVLDDPGHYLVGAAFAVRREAMDASGWIDAGTHVGRAGGALTSGNDSELFVLARQAGWKLWYDPRAEVQHLIPDERQEMAYLKRLAYAIALAEPRIKWLAHGKPGPEWIAKHAARAVSKRRRTLLTEVRPSRRVLRLAERTGRRDGWLELQREQGGTA